MPPEEAEGICVDEDDDDDEEEEDEEDGAEYGARPATTRATPRSIMISILQCWRCGVQKEKLPRLFSGLRTIYGVRMGLHIWRAAAAV